MKEGFVVKVNWLLFRKAILNNLHLLGVTNPKEFFYKAKKTYKLDLQSIPEYGKHDILKVNLIHAVMLGAIYKQCEQKPSILALTEFYRAVLLSPNVVTWYLNKMDMLSPQAIEKEIRQSEKSQHATHPYTWQYEISVENADRYTATFSKCGIYEYLKNQGIPEVVPAMCAIDFTFAEMSNHYFTRNNTLATQSSICDCHYVRKSAATEEEKAKFLEDQKNEAAKAKEIYKP